MTNHLPNPFWNEKGKIKPALLYEFFKSIGVGLYYPDDDDSKSSKPIVVQVVGNFVNTVNDTYLLQLSKRFIMENASTEKIRLAALDSLHGTVRLFGDKNFSLLDKLDLEFV